MKKLTSQSEERYKYRRVEQQAFQRSCVSIQCLPPVVTNKWLPGYNIALNINTITDKKLLLSLHSKRDATLFHVFLKTAYNFL